MRTSAAAIVLFAMFAPPALAQADVATIVARASAYVETFQRDFGMMVAEERYAQDVRAPAPPILRGGRGVLGTASIGTVLRSDFLLVRTAEAGWMPFRDVFERDGTPVRDRENRLTALFLNNPRSALEQARQIMEESARYNVGNVSRNINLPTLALDFLMADHRPRFVFEDGGRDESGRILRFKEEGRPTYIKTTANRDLPVYGRYWVDEATGRIQRTELHAVDSAVEAHITVTYLPDAVSSSWVPARMEERYVRRGDPAEVRGVATYSNFRRFQVQTTEELVDRPN